MKFFRKKQPPAAPAPASSHKAALPVDFYAKPHEETLTDHTPVNVSFGRQSRTSQHTQGRRRETSNRAGDWTLFLLLAKFGLVLALIAGGFFGLRFLVNWIQAPADEKTAEQPAALAAAPAPSPSVPAEAAALAADAGWMQQRLDRWALAERQQRTADVLAGRGDEEAMARLKEALEAAPEQAATLRSLADIYLRINRPAEAVPLLVRLLEQDSRAQEVQLKLLHALHRSGRPDAAAVMAQRILQDRPDHPETLSIAAECYVARNRTDEALKIYERILARDPKNLTALRGGGRIHLNRQEYQEAIPHYLELVRAAPQLDDYKTLAFCYAQLGQAGKTVVLMGQAGSLFGETVVTPWLRDAGLDPVRETVEFRAYADSVVGEETRKAIEALNKREAAEEMEAEAELPAVPRLELLKK